jgi:cytosine/uracil/thiamine/allantoin permease
MTKKSDFAAAYSAGKGAVEGKSSSAVVLVGVVLAVLVGPVVEKWLIARYSPRWFVAFTISMLVILTLTYLFALIEGRVKRARREKTANRP